MEDMDIKVFVGIGGSGKDFQCDILGLQGYIKMSLGNPIRAIVAEQLDMTEEDFMEKYEELKDNRLYIKTETGNTLAVFDGRKLFTGLGEGLKVYLGQKVWVKILEDKLVTAKRNKATKICIQDCRLWYELEFFLKLGAEVRFTNYKSSRYYLSDNPTITEHLATWFVKKGYEHLQVITKKDLELYKAEMEPGFIELPIG
jgi:hypothetical protein